MRQRRKSKSLQVALRDNLGNYPGGEIIVKGLNDIRHRHYRSIEALCVFIASPRLNNMGFSVNENFFRHPHLILYEKLKKIHFADAYSQYNALMKRVAKFCNHYEGARR